MPEEAAMRATHATTPPEAFAGFANHQLTLVVDLDERGSFRAHVENANGESLFEFSNEDENGWPSGDDLWLVEFGYMRHPRDVDGLLDYLRTMGIAGASAVMTIQG